MAFRFLLQHRSILIRGAHLDVFGVPDQTAHYLIRGLETSRFISDRKLNQFLLSEHLVECLKRESER